MRFLALGPMEVDGAELRVLSAAKHRALLAMLFINANHVVSVGSLVDELWQTPPPTATNLIRQYVSQLRKSLTERGETGLRLRTHASGYTLTIQDAASDVTDFEGLVRQGRAHLEAGRPARTCQVVADALGLWRGNAYADAPDGPTISAERARLEELRASALELRTHAQLQAGDFAGAISDLTYLTLHYPLREGPYANLMRALAATGRKADALGVYRSARETLISELGLEPGEELRQVEHAILADELGRPAAAAAEAAAPAQLPRGLTDFVGRGPQISQLDAHLTRTHRSPDPSGIPPLAVLSGPAGVGKTSLAVRLGHELEYAFPDGQIFMRLGHDAGEPVSPVAALSRAIEVLGCHQAEQPTGFLAKQDLYRRLLAARRTLLILDDAVDEAQVRPLLPSQGGCAVLVTSRSRLAGLDGAKHRPVQPFTSAESVELISRVAGHDRVAAESKAAHAIASACGGLPIAVRAAAARVDTQPHRTLCHLAERLSGAGIFDELTVGDVNLRETMAGAYSALEPSERRVLTGLAAYEPRRTFGERDIDASSRSVDQLVEAGVLELVGTDTDGQLRFRCAELVRRYAQERALLGAVSALVTLTPLRAVP